MNTNTSKSQSDSNIENDILNYLNEVCDKLTNMLYTQKNGYKPPKKPIAVTLPDTLNANAGFKRTVIPLDGAKPVILYSEFKKNDDGFLLIEFIINQLEMAILTNSDQPNNNGNYTFYSAYNEDLSPADAADLIYITATKLLSNITKELLGISFDDIDLLSSTYYESKKANGVLFFAASKNGKLKRLSNMCAWVSESTDITFEKKNIKYIRKLLVGGEESGLVFVTDSADSPAFFLGTAKNEYKDSFPIRIDISGPLKWKMSINGKEAFRKEINSIVLNTEITVEDIISEAKNIFGENNIKESELYSLIESVYNSKHGSALVLIDGSDRNGEVFEWLTDLKQYNKATAIAACDSLKGCYLDKASAMDGAIVIDVSVPKVIAIAAIVSEKTCIMGDPGRGSRYNSLKNFAYLMTKNGKNILTLVFSEDGDKFMFPGKD